MYQVTEPIQWRGFYTNGRNKIRMLFQNLVFRSDGIIEGDGSNSTGPYLISGRCQANGVFHFRLLPQNGQDEKQFKGTVLGDGALKGTFSSRSYPWTNFELRTKMDNWSGTFMQNGQASELQLNANVTTFIFGIGRDTTGAFVINGNVNTSNYAFGFSKAYINKFSVDYTGNLVNNGLFWVMSGVYMIGGQNNSGQFEIFKEAPASQKFNPMLRQNPMMFQQPLPMPMQMNPMMNQAPPQRMPQQQQQPSLIEKFDLPKGGTKKDVLNLFKTIQSKGQKIGGKEVAFYVKKIAFEDVLMVFFKKLPVYLGPCTVNDIIDTFKRTTFLSAQILAIKVMAPFVKPKINRGGKKKILDLIVFNSEKAEIQKFFDNKMDQFA